MEENTFKLLKQEYEFLSVIKQLVYIMSCVKINEQISKVYLTLAV